MNSVLVTGGSGAFGTAFIRRILTTTDIDRIVVYSRGEYRQATMAAELQPLDPDKRVRYFIGCVRDKDRLRRALRGIDTIVHAAALKRIEVGNYNPDEMLKTNVFGSQNIVDAAMETGVRRVVLTSSDKAFQPVSPYGNSKAMAESLFLSANNIRGWTGPLFSVCRYGNVWCSTGSVVPTWRAILDSGRDTVPVTDPECTRFFMRMDEAVNLVLETIDSMKGGEINIPTLPAYRLGDLAEAMDAKMEIAGLPPWEKKNEAMSDTLRSETARRMTVSELRRQLETA